MIRGDGRCRHQNGIPRTRTPAKVHGKGKGLETVSVLRVQEQEAGKADRGTHQKDEKRQVYPEPDQISRNPTETLPQI